LSDKGHNEPSFPTTLVNLLVMEERVVKHKQENKDEVWVEVNPDDLLFVELPEELQYKSNDFHREDF